MISRFLGLLAAFLFFVSAASAGFYVIEEDGERRKVAPTPQTSDQAKTGAKDSGDELNKGGSGYSNQREHEGFLRLAGGVMEGALDMNGFSLTGLPEPDSSADAATKSYVDSAVEVNGTADNRTVVNRTVVRKVNRTVVNRTVVNRTKVNKTVVRREGGGSERAVPSLAEVLGSGNVISRPISFASGVALGKEASAEAGGIAIGRGSESSGDGLSLGWKSEAEQGAVALGRGAEASGERSVALGKNVEAEESDTFVLGGENTTVKIPGNLEAGTERDEGRAMATFSVNSSRSGTEVGVPEEIGEDYRVSATPVGTLADVGVFNRTDSGFEVRSSEPTEVDLVVAESER